MEGRSLERKRSLKNFLQKGGALLRGGAHSKIYGICTNEIRFYQKNTKQGLNITSIGSVCFSCNSVSKTSQDEIVWAIILATKHSFDRQLQNYGID